MAGNLQLGAVNVTCSKVVSQAKRMIYSLLFSFFVYKLYFLWGVSSLPEGGDYVFNNWVEWSFSIYDAVYVLCFFVFFYGFSFFWVKSLNYLGLSVWSFFVGVYLPYILYPFDNGAKIEAFAERVLLNLGSDFLSAILPWLFLFLFFCFPAFIGFLLKKIKFLKVEGFRPKSK